MRLHELNRCDRFLLLELNLLSASQADSSVTNGICVSLVNNCSFAYSMVLTELL